MVMHNADRLYELSIKCDRYEKLPIDRRFLASLPINEIFIAAAILESDAFRIFALIEHCWGKNFLEKVFLKTFAHLFNENAEVNFSKRLSEIQNNC
jgi:hypothetical protein